MFLKHGAKNTKENNLVAPRDSTRPNWVVPLDGTFRVAA